MWEPGGLDMLKATRFEGYKMGEERSNRPGLRRTSHGPSFDPMKLRAKNKLFLDVTGLQGSMPNMDCG